MTQFSGNHGMAYGGSLQFTLSSFSGDFAIDKQNQEVTTPFIYFIQRGG
jgi:hypothetical protein